jgi:hypothetical protein
LTLFHHLDFIEHYRKNSNAGMLQGR